MPSLAVLQRSVEKLCAGYGRNTSEAALDAYLEATRDISDEELEIATTRLLRQGDQFMPSAPQVRKTALDVRQDRANYSRREDDQRRIKCLRCEDRGLVLTINRYWLLEHRGDFCASWFVDGWYREAHLWCLHNGPDKGFKSLLPYLICACDCRMANIYRKQLQRWNNRDPADKRIPMPAFWNQLHARDCEVPTPIYDSWSEALATILIAWREEDRQETTWDGNWTP